MKASIGKACLNGWWDFIPLYGEGTPEAVPNQGWLEGQYLVPSFWTKPDDGVRAKGEAVYRAQHTADIYDGKHEFLFDAFGYPAAWSTTRSGWVRRGLKVEALPAGRRLWLAFEAVMPKTRLFVNCVAVCQHIHPTLPLEADITDFVHEGDNEIAVLIENYDRDEKGRAKVPSGNWIPCDHSGIWQDVWLVERGEVYLSDVTVQTSTRQETLRVSFEVSNMTQQARQIRIEAKVRAWRKGLGDGEGAEVHSLPPAYLAPGAGERASCEVSSVWQDAEWWAPEHPTLYQLETALYEGDALIEVSHERFGFREVWVEGPDLMLNDHPVHLFSDWGHKLSPYYATEGWTRQWFGMIRDANMNHSRLHTHPHPPVILRIADEEGILITDEAGLHGAGGAQAASSAEYWDAAEDHVRRFVQRDKNHPCVILWSVENEMRWNTKRDTERTEARMIEEELPKLRRLFEALDPTRPVYHDGDSSLWNEKTQTIISRHYGKECAGIGWWDQTQPLHSGEMALYHYAGPNNTLHLGGDSVYASFAAIDACAARDAALIIETGRSLGVCAFGPWNLSCLENLRLEKEDVRLAYEDITAPGMKPLQVPAHSSEFSFWKAGKGYVPNTSFAIQAHAFRPLAIIDRSLKSSAYVGTELKRELFIVNDTADAVDGTLEVSLSRGDAELYRMAQVVRVERGRVVSRQIQIPLPADAEPGLYSYTATFRQGDSELDAWTRSIRVARRARWTMSNARTIGVYGPGSTRPLLIELGVPFVYVGALGEEALAGVEVLLMEKGTVTAGSQQNQQIQAFVQRGGRVVVLEQTHSLFPGLRLEGKPVLSAFVRAAAHPVLEGFEDSDFFAWGDDSYALLASDAYVATRMYRKDDGRLMLPLLDSGEGGFGSGDLETTPLFEAEEGQGLILACQLRLSDAFHDTPPAAEMLVRLLERAVSFRPAAQRGPIVVDGGLVEGLATYRVRAAAGEQIVVQNASAEALEAWGRELGIALRASPVRVAYQAVRTAPDAVLNGVSNADTCGIETFSYVPPSAANFEVGQVFIAPAEGLASLLETPTASCLTELMVWGGKSEALRAHTLSRFLYEEKPERAIVVGRVAVGKGEVIFNQFAPAEGTRERLKRLGHRLLANLGERFEGSLLDGEATSTTGASGPGYPQQVFEYGGPCDAALEQQFVDSTRPSMERMLATPILNLAAWRSRRSAEGLWAAEGTAAGQPIYLYYPIWSPTPRKNVETDLDVPNPEALTFLDLEGSGTVEVTINGVRYPKPDLGTGAATVSDISLEMGGNHVLLRWIPPDDRAALKMRWRNIMRQPETELVFGAGGSAD